MLKYAPHINKANEVHLIEFYSGSRKYKQKFNE